MKTIAMAAALALTVFTCSLPAQDGGGPPPPEKGPKGAGPMRPPGFHVHVLPPHAAEALNLTDEQKKQIAELEAKVQARLEKILTPGQLDQLKQMHPPHPPGGPAGGPDAGGPAGGPAPEGTPAGKPFGTTSGTGATQ